MPDDEKAKRLVDELGTDTFKEIASSPLMLTMMVSVYVSNNFTVISNRSELYEMALRTIMGRSDKERAGLARVRQEELLEHLLKLAAEAFGGRDPDGDAGHHGHAELALQPAASALGNFWIKADVGISLRNSQQICW